MQTRRIILKLTSILLAGLVPSIPAAGQFHQDFESPATTWNRSDTDCIIPTVHWSQNRSQELEAHNRFEKISFQSSAGTQVLASHDVSPAFVISELTPSVRIKANRPGTRLMVRVVLPHTPSATGDGPLTTLLSGPAAGRTNQWETLSFESEIKNLQQLLQEEIWVLRRQHGSHVTQRDAYVDKVVLNLYTGTGETNVQIDDLKLDGIVAADRVAHQVSLQGTIRRDDQVRLTRAEESLEKPTSLVVRDGTVLLVKKKPFFPRIVQYNGESFEFLQSLGFNVIQLSNTATDAQLQRAQKLDLWIVCPPPPSVGLSPIAFQYDRVLAWSVGMELVGRNLQHVQQTIREIRESDQRLGRPIVGGASTHWTRLAQHIDILHVGQEPIGSSFLASQYSNWIRHRSQTIASSKPVWADIQTELSESLTDQIGIIAKQVPPTPVAPQQIKFLVYEAIAGGARGLRFRSRSRLDGTDPTTRLRALTIEWINSTITRLEPWAVAGAWMGEIPTDDPELEVTAISTNRSRLLLIQRPTHHEQYVAGDVPVRTVRFRDSEAAFTDRAYRVLDTGLELLHNKRSHGGNDIQIEHCPYCTAVVLTQDPLISTKLNESYRRTGQRTTLQMRTELTRQWLAIMQLIDRQMGQIGRRTPALSAALNESVNALRTANSLLENNSDQTALPYLERTDERLAFTRREMITEPLGRFQSKTSSPLTAHCSLIPLHWELTRQLDSQDWNPNGLTGGDFENLPQMMHGGWRNQRLDNPNIRTKVELNEKAAFAGQYGLRLHAGSQTRLGRSIDTIPLWISTPRIPVRGNQLVRIHGWINIPTVIKGNPDGLKIIDSLGGEAMTERIPVTHGWQEFTLYRATGSDRDFQITFALTGLGEAMIDEVTVRTVDMPQPQRQAQK